ncbi:MAG: hypothetical protein SNJ78_10835 [Spirochaetales bacterium]
MAPKNTKKRLGKQAVSFPAHPFLWKNAILGIGYLKSSQKGFAQPGEHTREVAIKNLITELHVSLEATRKMMAGLSDSVGFTLEDRPIKNLAPLLKERFGFKVGEKLGWKFLPYPGGSLEVDTYGMAEKERKRITLVGEAKTHISTKHIDRFLHQIEKLKILEAVIGEIFPLMVAYSLPPDVELYAPQKLVTLFPSYEISN